LIYWEYGRSGGKRAALNQQGTCGSYPVYRLIYWEYGRSGGKRAALNQQGTTLLSMKKGIKIIS